MFTTEIQIQCLQLTEFIHVSPWSHYVIPHSSLVLQAMGFY